MRTKVEFGDVLLLVYLIAITRQWFWPINNSVAWVLTIPIAFALWFFYVVTKRDVDQGPELHFWIIVGLPLLAAFLLRFPFPDTSFDVWGVRLFHGERGLKGFIYWPGEFFPTPAPFNPTPDMITGIFRKLLGYRLGTVINLLALLWSALVLEKLLRPFKPVTGVVAPSVFISIGVLLIVTAEHLLFEINNYMPDLLALPLLLEATRITFKENVPELVTHRIVRVAFLIGMAVAIKLSNGGVALPLVLIWIWRLLGVRKIGFRKIAITSVASVIVVVWQILPFSVWVYKLTGSPVFPLYNKIFRSPLMLPLNGWDDRWGGYGVYEVLAWPFLMFLKPVRTAELPVYTGRLSVGVIVAIFCLIAARRFLPTTRAIAIILLVGTLLWSITMGYIRYGLYLEVLAGVLVVMIAARLVGIRHTPEGRRIPVHIVSLGISLILIIVLGAQTVMAFVYLQRYEWSLRPTIFTERRQYMRELRYVLRDREIKPLLGKREQELFGATDVWFVSGIKTVGLMPFLNERSKVIGVRAAGLFLAPANREFFQRCVTNVEGQNLRSFAHEVDYLDSVYTLRTMGLAVGNPETVVIPIFSADDLMPVYTFDVIRDTPRPLPTKTVIETALPDNAYRASLNPVPTERTLKPGQIRTDFFRVQNTSDGNWPSQAGVDRKFQIVLRARWLNSRGTEVGDASESPLPFDFAPTETTALPLKLVAPSDPGTYTLEVDMAQRTGPSFSSKGSPTLKLDYQVR